MSEKLTLEQIKSLSDTALEKLLKPFAPDIIRRNYCEDLNHVAALERVVIDKVGIDKYYEAVCKTSNEEFIATARERAEAALLALQENNL